MPPLTDGELTTLEVVTALGAISAIGVAVAGVLPPIHRWWKRKVRPRQTQTQLLDQLACGRPTEYIDQLLGTADHLRQLDGRDERLYRLPGAWVTVESHAGTVISFSITITNASMYYPTRRHTFGLVDVNLGRSAFDEVQEHVSGWRLWYGASRAGYLQYMTFGRPGLYQDYWLSYNLSGVGSLHPPREHHLCEAGAYAGGRVSQLDERSPEGITVNTLTVLGAERPEEAKSEFMNRHVLGADSDVAGLVVSPNAQRRSIPSKLFRPRSRR
ncbi:ETEC_3214 domain-containing protein [Rhodococcus coprophilus]|uniref:ETEC_3214 domain-containing protein n=1 Tax=Rhodococcus coprophilus TaxID=38310 RepID=UPI0033EE4F24